MGMDVYGKAPTSPVGEYFRNNVWWWRPLANYCIATAPNIAGHREHWHSNEGSGLDAELSVALADALQSRLDNGECAAYAEAYQRRLDTIPDKPCWLCDGTGIRSDGAFGQHKKVITGPPDHPRLGQTGWCNGCDGTGRQEAIEKAYPFSIENVTEFVAFLRECGGFRIY